MGNSSAFWGRLEGRITFFMTLWGVGCFVLCGSVGLAVRQPGPLVTLIVGYAPTCMLMAWLVS